MGNGKTLQGISGTNEYYVLRSPKDLSKAVRELIERKTVPDQYVRAGAQIAEPILQYAAQLPADALAHQTIASAINAAYRGMTPRERKQYNDFFFPK